MKNHALRCIMFISVLLLVASCKKEAGPQGATGATGATGSTGTTGHTGSTGSAGQSIPVIVENFTVDSSDWQRAGTAHTTSAHIYYEYHSLNITSDVVANGTVLVYLKNSSIDEYSALPYTYWGDTTVQVNMRPFYGSGYVGVNIILSNFLFLILHQPLHYKIIIIPGAHKKDWPIDLNDYNAVKAYFKLE